MEPYSKLKGFDELHLLNKTSQKCCRNLFIYLNILLISVGAILIGITAYWTRYFGIVALTPLIGLLIAGVLVVIVSILGVIGMVRQNQKMLFVYMFAIIFLFVVLLFLSAEAIMLSTDLQSVGIEEAWSASNEEQKEHIEKMLKWCGLIMEKNRENLCNVTSPGHQDNVPCYNKLMGAIDKAGKCAAGVALFFAFILLVSFYVVIKYCNKMREPEIDDENA